MSQIISFASIIVCIAFLGLCIALSVAHILDRIATIREQRARLFLEDVVKSIGQRLSQDSYWFTENIPAYLAIKCLGDAMSQDGCYNVDRVRDQWRSLLRNETDRRTKSES